MNKSPNIGLTDTDRDLIAEGLAKVLAETYTLYLKSHNYHWNVTGPLFSSLHLMFETHYTELAAAVDVIAERIRALGEYAPGTFAEFAELSTIDEANGVPDAMDMVRILAADHETIVHTAREAVQLANDAGDEVTLGLLTDRMTIHEKTAWMLRSIASE